MPYANVNASVLFLKKADKAHIRTASTFYAKAECVGRKGNGDDDYIYEENGIARLNSDLPRIIELYGSYRESGEVETVELAYATNIATICPEEDDSWRLHFRYHHPSRKVSRELLARAKGQLLTLVEICEERNQTLIPSTELEDTTILYTGLAHIEAHTGIAHQVPTPANSLKSAVKRYEPGDIVFARMRPNLRKVALMEFAEGGYVSPECFVFRVRTNKEGRPIIDPLLLSALLRSDLVYGQIMHLIAGIGRPRLSVSDLRRVKIPRAEEASQRKWRSSYLAEMSAAAKLRERATRLFSEAAVLERGAVDQLAKEFV